MIIPSNQCGGALPGEAKKERRSSKKRSQNEENPQRGLNPSLFPVRRSILSRFLALATREDG